MTPRSIKSNHDSRNDFAKQVADQTGQRGQDGQPARKKFRSSAAPKGTRLATGYVDRAKERLLEQEDEGEDKQTRLKRLEEMLKEEKIDQDTFEKLREELGVGGDISSTHLVKGLDFKLLERVRRGEDVNKAADADADTTEASPVAEDDADVEGELERALEKDVAASARSTSQGLVDDEDVASSQTLDPAGETATLSRDEILRRLRENRKNPGISTTAEPLPEAPQVALDHSKFRKLESAKKPNKHKYTETVNGRRREVLVITAKDGTTKRKTRWLDPEPDPSSAKKHEEERWGGDLPAELLARQQASIEEAAKHDKDEDDDDIFGGVTDYDPLAGLNSDEEEEQEAGEIMKHDQEPAKATVEEEATARSAKPLKSTSQPRNYFTTGTADVTEETSKAPAHDPTIIAAIKRAAQIRKQEEEGAEGADSTPQEGSGTAAKPASEESERSRALLKKLQQQSRQDDIDLDMGFGGDTRYDDDEGGDGKQKLSEWKGADAYGEDDDEDGGNKGEAAKRKRGGKKKKGDKNSYADLMSVIEGRKKG